MTIWFSSHLAFFQSTNTHTHTHGYTPHILTKWYGDSLVRWGQAYTRNAIDRNTHNYFTTKWNEWPVIFLPLFWCIQNERKKTNQFDDGIDKEYGWWKIDAIEQNSSHTRASVRTTNAKYALNERIHSAFYFTAIFFFFQFFLDLFMVSILFCSNPCSSFENLM